jgi:hypothetical protein
MAQHYRHPHGRFGRSGAVQLTARARGQRAGKRRGESRRPRDTGLAANVQRLNLAHRSFRRRAPSRAVSWRFARMQSRSYGAAQVAVPATPRACRRLGRVHAARIEPVLRPDGPAARSRHLRRRLPGPPMASALCGVSPARAPFRPRPPQATWFRRLGRARTAREEQERELLDRALQPGTAGRSARVPWRRARVASRRRSTCSPVRSSTLRSRRPRSDEYARSPSARSSRYSTGSSTRHSRCVRALPARSPPWPAASWSAGSRDCAQRPGSASSSARRCRWTSGRCPGEWTLSAEEHRAISDRSRSGSPAACARATTLAAASSGGPIEDGAPVTCRLLCRSATRVAYRACALTRSRKVDDDISPQAVPRCKGS